MRAALIVLLLVHGAIHLLGFVKAFRIAEVPQLTHAIARPAGALWLLATLLFSASALLLATTRGFWWVAAVPAVVLSEALIVSAWSDARFGTVANVIVAVPLALALLDLRPTSLRSMYERDVAARMTPINEPAIVTESDLAGLPPEVATYLRRVGAVGRPRVHDVELRFVAEMKPSIDAPWMQSTAEQHEFFDRPPVRLFYMSGTMKGVPFAGYHRFADGAATMQIRAASLFDVADARGPEMNQSETVTLFNDMCVMAPATLIDADVEWTRAEPGRKVHARFHNGEVTIGADLFFDEAGDLVDFLSNDRFLSADGKTYASYPWQTPLRDYREIDGIRVAARGDAIWKRPAAEGGDFVYGRFTIERIAYNVGPRTAPRLALGLAR